MNQMRRSTRERERERRERDERDEERRVTFVFLLLPSIICIFAFCVGLSRTSIVDVCILLTSATSLFFSISDIVTTVCNSFCCC